MNSTHTTIITLIIFTFISISSYAQINKAEKRIYLFDVTASMEGKGVVQTANVFSSVKRNLQHSIELIKNKNTLSPEVLWKPEFSEITFITVHVYIWRHGRAG